MRESGGGRANWKGAGWGGGKGREARWCLRQARWCLRQASKAGKVDKVVPQAGRQLTHTAHKIQPSHHPHSGQGLNPPKYMQCKRPEGKWEGAQVRMLRAHLACMLLLAPFARREEDLCDAWLAMPAWKWDSKGMGTCKA